MKSHSSNRIKCFQFFSQVVINRNLSAEDKYSREGQRIFSVSLPTRSVDRSINILQLLRLNLSSSVVANQLNFVHSKTSNLFFNKVSYLSFVALSVELKIKFGPAPKSVELSYTSESSVEDSNMLTPCL
ncbi:hypothetical protein QL285_039503 [Trifolium repens]|nr:hypothetical protein QL285_039503 [Trifolium repens]